MEHEPIHTTAYLRRARNHLDDYATMDGSSLSYGGMLGVLREMKKEIRRAMRSSKFSFLLLTAIVATPIALASGSDSGGEVSSATAKTPTGRTVTLTVRKGKGPASSWCAKAAVGGERTVSQEHCGRGADEGLHGAFIADCEARELIADGAVRPSIEIVQPRPGRRAITATYAQRPSGVRFHGHHYVLVVDLRERHPRLVARRAGQTIANVNFTREARACDGLAITGGF